MPIAPATQADYLALSLVGNAYLNSSGSWGPNPHEKVLFHAGLSSVHAYVYYRMNIDTSNFLERRYYEVRDGSNNLLQSGITFFDTVTNFPPNNSPSTPARVYSYSSVGGLRLRRVGYFNGQPLYMAL